MLNAFIMTSSHVKWTPDKSTNNINECKNGKPNIYSLPKTVRAIVALYKRASVTPPFK